MKNSFLEKIENDLFDIAKRLKEIDERYVLVKNKKSGDVEVYSFGGDSNLSIAVVSPFGKIIDNRLIDYVKETRVCRANEIFKEIEEHNEKLEKENERKINERLKDRLFDLKKLINHYM